MSKKESIFIGIDLGTTNVKAVALTAGGKIVTSSSRSLSLINDKPNWFEQDSDQWWEKTAECIKDVVNHSSIQSENICGVAASGQGCGALPVDSSGKPIMNALIWMDFRGKAECDSFEQQQDTIFSLSGNNLDPVQNVASILWLKKHQPEVYKNTHKFLTATAFLNFKLSGKFAVNVSDAGLSVFFDMKKNNWSDELAKLYGISLEKLPVIAKCTDIIGGVTRRAAEETGLQEGTPVTAGGEDTSSAALAAGVYKGGQVCLSTGTSSNLVLCTDKPIAIKNSLNFPHVIEGLRFLSGNIPSTGSCMEWFKDILQSGPGSLKMLDREAESAPAGSSNLIFLPYLAGSAYPVSNPDARGVFFGLTLGTTRGEMIRSIMEGVSFAHKSIINYLHDSGFPVNEMSAIGGMTNSNIWNQLTCDICGFPMNLVNSMAEAPVGDAMIAGVAVGAFSSFEDAVQKVITKGKLYIPNPDNTSMYNKLFKLKMEIFNTLGPAFQALSKQGVK